MLCVAPEVWILLLLVTSGQIQKPASCFPSFSVEQSLPTLLRHITCLHYIKAKCFLLARLLRCQSTCRDYNFPNICIAILCRRFQSLLLFQIRAGCKGILSHHRSPWHDKTHRTTVWNPPPTGFNAAPPTGAHVYTHGGAAAVPRLTNHHEACVSCSLPSRAQLRGRGGLQSDGDLTMLQAAYGILIIVSFWVCLLTEN